MTESRCSMLHCLGVMVAAGLLGSIAARTGDAQTVRGSAMIGIAPVVQIRSVSVPSTRRLGKRLLEVTQQVTTAANTRYNLNVLSLGDAVDSRVLVQSVNGGFVPVTSGSNIVATSGDRGGESVTTVVMRIETTNPAEALAFIGFQAVAESASGALVASAPVTASSGALSVALR